MSQDCGWETQGMKRIGAGGVAAVIGLLLAGGALGQDASAGRATVEKQVLEIIEPTQGRPIVVRPEENFYFMFWTSQEQITKLDVSLVNSLSTRARVPLTAPVRPYRMQKRTG